MTELKYPAARAQMRMCLRELRDVWLQRSQWADRNGVVDDLMGVLEDTGCLEDDAKTLIGGSLRNEAEAAAIDDLSAKADILIEDVERGQWYKDASIPERWYDSKVIMGLASWPGIVDSGREAYHLLISSPEARPEITSALQWLIGLESASNVEALNEESHHMYCVLWMNNCIDGSATELLGHSLRDTNEAAAIDRFATEFSSILMTVEWNASEYVMHPRFDRLVERARSAALLLQRRM